MINTNSFSVNKQNFNFIGWKAYNQIKKKAMEQKFSWSGLGLSLSIAFFVVLMSAQILNIFYQSIETARNHEYFLNQKVYHLESVKHINSQAGEIINQLFSVKIAKASQIDGYQGEVSKDTDYLQMDSGDEIEYNVQIKNIGSEIWNKGEVFFETGPFLRSISKLRHEKWLNFYRPVNLNNDIAPGEIAYLTFYLKAPDDINGTIQENFQLVINNRLISGTTLRLFTELKGIDMADDKIKIENISANNLLESSNLENITADLMQNNENFNFCATLSDQDKMDYEECRTDLNEIDFTNGITQHIIFDNEPIIRIGLFNTEEAQRITCDYYYDVYSGERLLLSGLPAGYISIVSFDFNIRQYILSTSGTTKFLDEPIRFISRKANSVMTLVDFSNSPAWNPNLNDNKFRNIIEFNHSMYTGKLWIINELPMNYYLKGLAETSNYSPLDYQKVIATAARTYAMYHYNRGIEYEIDNGSTKHGYENFHLDAVYDQVYRGYNSEIRLTILSQAVDETKGVVITYDNNVVVTPYFSRSDGRTRGWEEVWYGNAKPWLQSVLVPEDEGQTLWGHGVGMSARGALIMVRDKLKKWQETLKYFYYGIDLQKIYD